jgi:hypothetical protein
MDGGYRKKCASLLVPSNRIICCAHVVHVYWTKFAASCRTIPCCRERPSRPPQTPTTCRPAARAQPHRAGAVQTHGRASSAQCPPSSAPRGTPLLPRPRDRTPGGCKRLCIIQKNLAIHTFYKRSVVAKSLRLLINAMFSGYFASNILYFSVRFQMAASSLPSDGTDEYNTKQMWRSRPRIPSDRRPSKGNISTYDVAAARSPGHLLRHNKLARVGQRRRPRALACIRFGQQMLHQETEMIHEKLP